MNSKQLIFITEFEKFINATASGRRLSSSGKKVSSGVVDNYLYTKRLIEEYQEHQQEILRISILNKASIKILQKEKNYWMKFYRQFTAFLYKNKGYYDNYVTTMFKNIKTFFNYLNNEKGIPVGQYHKLFRIPQQKFSPVVLTPEQLSFLISNKEFYDGLTPQLKKIRDIMIIGCTLGMRISDLVKLKKKNLISNGSETYISTNTQKTGTEVKIPIPSYVISIFDQHKTKGKQELLPKINIGDINVQLKLLAEQAGWTYIVPKKMCRQGKIMEIVNNKGKSYRFCDHITAHTMRRTAITTLLILGVPELVVRKLSGHAAGSREFFRYISIANDYSNQKIIEAQNKLLNYNKKEHQTNTISLL